MSTVATPSDTGNHTENKVDSQTHVPEGSVQILYCEQCGCLILGGEKNAVKNDGVPYCKKCVQANTAKTQTAIIPPKSKRVETARLKSAEAAARTESQRRPATTRARRALMESSVTGRARRSTGSMATPAANKPSGPSATAYAMIGGGALLVAFGLGAVFMGGGKKAEHASERSARAAKETEEAKSVNLVATGREEPTRARETVGPLSTRVTEPDTAKADTAAATPPEPAKQELSPKERYEISQAHREPEADAAAAKGQGTATQAGNASQAPANESNPFGGDRKPAAAEPAQNDDPAAALGLRDTRGAKDDEAEEDLVAPPEALAQKQPADAAEEKPAEDANNPFVMDDPEAGRDPLTGRPVPKPEPDTAAPAAPPEFKRGKKNVLFPKGFDSRLEDINGQKRSRYDGWTYQANAQNLRGMSVKDGVLKVDGMAAMHLDGFGAKEFNFTCELKLKNANSGFMVQYGLANDNVGMVAVDPKGVVGMTWFPSKKADNIQAHRETGKPHNANPAGGWVKFAIAVRGNNVQVFVNDKAVNSFSPPNAYGSARLGFMSLGGKGAKDFGFSVRNAEVFAP